MQPRRITSALFALMTWALSPAHAADPSEDLFELEQLRVRITSELSYLEVTHRGRKVLLMRHQDPGHTIETPYDKTARDCPPFCIQPMQLAPGVETVGELEVIAFLRRREAGDESLLLIDSRTSEWVSNGTIPGAINIPYTRLDPAQATPSDIADLLQLEFGASRQDGIWSFEGVKTLILFCNGPWCGQSPTNILALLRLGYPAHKLKWYRGGVQVWEQFGLTTVKD